MRNVVRIGMERPANILAVGGIGEWRNGLGRRVWGLSVYICLKCLLTTKEHPALYKVISLEHDSVWKNATY